MPLRPDMTLGEYREVLLRRKGMVIASILLTLAGAGVYGLLTPRQYKSSTTILIVPQRVPENYVQSTVNVKIQDRLATIKQQVLSRTRLTMVMEELGLFKEERLKRIPEDLIEEMRKRIEVEVSGGKRRDEATEAFTISFVHESPQTAMLTASRMASFFIDENLKSREQQAVGTSQFLESQLQETKARLEEQEEKVKQYKLANMGELPQQTEANLNMLTRLQDRYKTISDSLRAAEDRKVFLTTQVGLLEKATPIAVGGEGMPQAASGGTADPVRALAVELAAHRVRLSNLSAKYTDRHPDIIQTRQEVGELEKRLAEMQRAAAGESAKGKGPAARSLPLSGLDPRSAEESRRLRAQAVGAEAEIASLKKTREEVQRQMAEIQARVDRSPKREQELISLTRDYENLKKKYDDLLAKKLEADISQNLEKRQKGEQFQVIDPANLPEKPFKPDLPKVLGVAFFAAFSLGLGGAWVREMSDLSLRGRRDFKHFVRLPVLAAVPAKMPEEGRRFSFGRPAGRLPEDEGPRFPLVRGGQGDPFFLERFIPLRARVEHKAETTRFKVLAVTSAVASEGKTISCAGLGACLAIAGWKRVLAIDADLYKPDLGRCLEMTAGPGLAEYLSGAARVEDVIRPSVFPGLSVITGGTRTGPKTGFLGQEPFRVFLKAIRERFDIVLIDTPPVLAVPDTVSLRTQADRFLFVYRAGHTPYPMIRQAVEEIGEKIVLGVVLNHMEPEKSKYYEKYCGKYYQPKIT